MLYILDRYENGVAVLSNNSPKALGYFVDEHIEQLDGIITYNFSVAANHADAEKIVAEGYVLVRDLDKKLIEFRIKRIEEYHDQNGAMYKKIYTENSAISDLLSEIVRPVKLLSKSLSEAAAQALAFTGWQLGDYDTNAPLQDYDFTNYPTGLAALQTIRQTLGLEIAYRVEFSGARVVNRYVDLVAKRGTDTGKRFEYGKDLVSIDRQEDTNNLVTALVGIGKSNPDGTRVTFTDIDTTSNGYYKPTGQDWVGSDDALAQFGKNGKHNFGLYEDTNADNWNALLDGATKKLAELSKPKLTYNMSILLLEQLTGLEADKVRIGDDIKVIDTTYSPPIRVDARVIEITRSYVDPTKDSVTLGEFADIFVDTSAKFSKFISFVNQKQGKWDASEVITKSPTEPTDKTDQMLWLDLSKTPNLLQRWDAASSTWQKATATNFNELNGQVTTTQITNNAVGTAQIAPKSVTSTEISDKAVDSAHISDGAVGTTQIAPKAVTSNTVADNAVGTTQLAPKAVTDAVLADAAVQARAIADQAVDALKLKDQAVTSGKIAPNAINSTHVSAGTITEAKVNWSTHLLF